MPPHFRRTEYSPFTRAIAMLLVALMLVAPSWHVCEMGGRHCAPSAEHLCHFAGDSGVPVLDAAPTHFHGTCLARLLMAMPAGLPAPAVFVLPAAQRSTLSSFVPRAPAALFLPRTPARGPPRLVI